MLAAEILFIEAASILEAPTLSEVIFTSAPAVAPASSILIVSEEPAVAAAFMFTVRLPEPFVIPTFAGRTATSLTVNEFVPPETSLIESNLESVFAKLTTKASLLGVILIVSIFSTFGVSVVEPALVRDKISLPAPPSKVSTSFNVPVVEKSNVSDPEAPTKLFTPVVPQNVCALEDAPELLTRIVEVPTVAESGEKTLI